MGRWYAALKKTSETGLEGTDKTDETSSARVLSVLSVPDLGKSENFQSDTEGSVSFVSSANERIENFSAHVEALDLHSKFEERAARYEFSAGMSRQDAEEAAWSEVYGDLLLPV